VGTGITESERPYPRRSDFRVLASGFVFVFMFVFRVQSSGFRVQGSSFRLARFAAYNAMPTIAETISMNAGKSSKKRMLRAYPTLGALLGDSLVFETDRTRVTEPGTRTLNKNPEARTLNKNPEARTRKRELGSWNVLSASSRRGSC
jgi:hypothetical protein